MGYQSDQNKITIQMELQSDHIFIHDCIAIVTIIMTKAHHIFTFLHTNPHSQPKALGKAWGASVLTRVDHSTLSAEGALKYLGDCMKRHSRLVSERERAEMQIDSLRRKDLHSAAARRAAQGGEAEAQDLERMLADIETFGESSRQVADAMRFLVQQYVVFAAGLLAKLVRASEDDMFLRAALRLGRYANAPSCVRAEHAFCLSCALSAAMHFCFFMIARIFHLFSWISL